MTDSISLPVREDNSTEDADRVAEWARAFKGVEAHVVFDYVQVGDQLEPGGVNGVTIQWAHHEEVLEPESLADFEIEFTDRDGDDQVVVAQKVDTPAVFAPVADEAVHVRPGQTGTRTRTGFEVSA